MATAKKGAKPKVSGVRFAAGFSEEGAHNHVHFEEKLHDSVVMVSREDDGNYLVKVGFLKILHKYEILFTLPALQRLGRNIIAVPLPNLNLKVTKITALPEGHAIKCEYTAHKEGVLKEEMILASETNHKTIVKVVVQARVLDRHHGTPMLLEGVRCIGAEPEYDSEQSDWHGFD
ncbi:adipose-secreted signaling protein [Hyla sarda]|uniref:adipose-secreted signaling protein n=1 Tax=Hyla sarda TaxID=327740 RepID=UPI0024C2EB01|nr:adipose-secreted signaling protein [Hyla sarda]